MFEARPRPSRSTNSCSSRTHAIRPPVIALHRSLLYTYSKCR
ncbi:hypothetical protein ART_2577 [Arthrobacter sp. PAMC 25486]|nr:hypothetical protein ART_2577 [Arthrobacter sp. PAMC 25486]